MSDETPQSSPTQGCRRYGRAVVITDLDDPSNFVEFLLHTGSVYVRTLVAREDPHVGFDFQEIRVDEDVVADFFADWSARTETPDLESELATLLVEGATTMLLTRAYVGAELLPAQEGWSWFDWIKKVEKRLDLAEMLAESASSIPSPAAETSAIIESTPQSPVRHVILPSGGTVDFDALGTIYPKEVEIGSTTVWRVAASTGLADPHTFILSDPVFASKSCATEAIHAMVRRFAAGEALVAVQ